MQQTDSLPIRSNCRPAVRKPSWQSVSGVNQAHPFYFDHPLDHVPGIMFIVELLGLVRQVVQQGEPQLAVNSANGMSADRGWLRTSLLFPRFGELDAETELRAWPSLRPGQWTFLAGQTVPGLRGHRVLPPFGPAGRPRAGPRLPGRTEPADDARVPGPPATAGEHPPR